MSRSRIFGVVALAAITVVVAPARTLDRAVGVQFRSSSHAYASALAIQADGKLVAVGSSDAAGKYGFALARFTRSGRLDASFGRDGKVLNGLGSDSYASDVAIQADGRIVVAGWNSTPAKRSEFALARYRRDGSLDASFGSGGKVLTSVGSDSGARGVAIRPDGKLVVAGWSGHIGTRLALARYTRAGRLDPSFGRGGKLLTSCEFYSGAVAIQPDGKIVVACEQRSYQGIARYHTDGTLDQTFGRGGWVSVWVRTFPNALAIQVDGRIVVVGGKGGFGDTGDSEEFAVARYMANGNLDEGFGSNGSVLTDFVRESNKTAIPAAVAMQTDGKLMAVGGIGIWYQGRSRSFSINNRFALARFTPDGNLDTSFGGGGKVVTGFGSDSSASDVAIQPDGRIVAAGSTTLSAKRRDFAIARYRKNGSLDARFGRGGKVTTNFGSG
jgi:uncharacterized delta-60 repeat protein